MAYVVTDACIGVVGEACIAVCPEHCIHNQPRDLMSFIDPARCTHCGVCAAACVVGAIRPEEALAESAREFIELNAQWFHHRAGVRTRVREIALENGLWLNPQEFSE